MVVANPAFRSSNFKRRRKLRLKKNVRKKLIKYGIFALLILIVSIILYFPISRKIDRLLHPRDVGKVNVDRYRDLNALHLKYAKANGIAGFKTEKDFKENIDELVDDDKLVLIEDSKYYVVDNLTHSHPYLTLKAAELLKDLGKRFQQKLDDKGLDKCYFQITSLLRTVETQKKLSRSNGNASSNTSHLYGTTFDIAYSRIIKKPLPWTQAEVADGPAIKLLSEALGELRKEGRCVIVTERNEACFHITVK